MSDIAHPYQVKDAEPYTLTDLNTAIKQLDVTRVNTNLGRLAQLLYFAAHDNARTHNRDNKARDDAYCKLCGLRAVNEAFYEIERTLPPDYNPGSAQVYRKTADILLSHFISYREPPK